MMRIAGVHSVTIFLYSFHNFLTKDEYIVHASKHV